MLCNAQAEIRPLDLREAQYCSSNFENLKIALNPEVSIDTFHRLDSKERARISVQSYRYYTTWLTANDGLAETIREIARQVARNDALTVSELDWQSGCHVRKRPCPQVRGHRLSARVV